jgi:hypothetical protein
MAKTPEHIRQARLIQNAVIEAAQASTFPLKDSLTIGEVEKWAVMIANRLRLRGYRVVKADQI